MIATGPLTALTVYSTSSTSRIAPDSHSVPFCQGMGAVISRGPRSAQDHRARGGQDEAEPGAARDGRQRRIDVRGGEDAAVAAPDREGECRFPHPVSCE